MSTLAHILSSLSLPLVIMPILTIKKGIPNAYQFILYSAYTNGKYSRTPTDTSKQEDALIAAKVAKALEDENVYTDYIPDVCQALEVNMSTLYKYLKMISGNDDMTMMDVDFIRTCGKPRKFPLEADVALIEWTEDPNTVSIEMTMTGLK